MNMSMDDVPRNDQPRRPRESGDPALRATNTDGKKELLDAPLSRGMTAVDDARAGDLAPASLYRLLAWLSPAFPVGAFSYSSGIEWAIEAGDIADAGTLGDWLTVTLTQGGGYCDAVLFAAAHRAIAHETDK
jgi:urease accessory protein